MRFTELAAATLKDTQAKETKPQPINKVEPKETNAAQPTPVANTVKPTGEEGKQTITTIKELKVELLTTQPTSAPEEKPTVIESSGRPVWMDKDKIFGDKNPFATK